eukprot:607143-Pyramimonas_sp.AAC.1
MYVNKVSPHDTFRHTPDSLKGNSLSGQVWHAPLTKGCSVFSDSGATERALEKDDEALYLKQLYVSTPILYYTLTSGEGPPCRCLRGAANRDVHTCWLVRRLLDSTSTQRALVSKVQHLQGQVAAVNATNGVVKEFRPISARLTKLTPGASGPETATP